MRSLHGVESDPKLSEKNFKNKGCPSLALMLSPDRLCTPATPGQARARPPWCPIYPLSAASVDSRTTRPMRVCHASASIKLRILAGEMQQPPMSHLFLLFFPLGVVVVFQSTLSPAARVSFGEEQVHVA